MNKIGLIGMGFIGAILKKWFPEAVCYDIKGGFDSWKEVKKSEIIFVAVNFKDNCSSEDSKTQLHNYFAELDKNTVVIFKSTFVPGTLDYFQNKFSHLRFLYNPEFLTEATAWEDFIQPQFQILGCPQQVLEVPNLVWDIFKLLPNAPVKRIISPLDAEILKHSINSYYALKVSWFNQLYDACQQLGGDYETVREIMVQNPWIGNSHSVIMHKGYRGYGGKCLSKDPLQFSKVAYFPLLDLIEKYNENLRKM